VPRIAFVNKMDRTGADFMRVVGMLRDRLGANAHPIQMPIGEGEDYKGVIDIIRRVELIYDDSTLGKNWTEQPVRAEFTEKVEELRTNLVEAAVETDEA
jgi:elongation factor G